MFESYEAAALAAKAAWDAGDFDAATVARREAQRFVEATARVVQMGDGALQLVPLEA